MNDNFNEKDLEINGAENEHLPEEGITAPEQIVPTGDFVFENANIPVSTEEKPKKKKSSFWRVLAIICAVALLIGAIAFGIHTASKIIGSFFDGTSFNNGPLQSMSGTHLTVNKSDLDVNASDLTKATYAAYDSSLLIQAYTDSSASTLASTGSGVLWNAEGYVVTCNHVVEGFSRVKVTFTDGSWYFAESIATDPATDLALLKITIPEGSEVCPITARDTEKSKLMLGETVIAIGNPLGYLTNTVTDGILSSLEREINVEGNNMMLMQVNAAVNSGNSGGGLYDINGSLIGIVNAKISDIDVEGIGFAIPIDTVIDVVTQLAEKGYVSGRPMIGISYAQVTYSNYRNVFARYPELSDYATASSGKWGSTLYPGIYIVEVRSDIKYAENSPSTLQYGDRMYQISDESGHYLTVESGDTVTTALSSMSVGDVINIMVMRAGQSVTVSVILSEKTTS
ncbi:MAG: trypsin-like serine protease [Ruminococcaceae bacterium]|nr:trypsin-like serine protease [Oscillospiraceae bacterium]